MLGLNTKFRHKSRRVAKKYYAGILTCAMGTAATGGAIMMQNEAIFINGDILKTRKGLRT
jgi:hypothetical protein